MCYKIKPEGETMTDEEKAIEEIFKEMMEQIWIKTEDEDKYENVKRLIRETAKKAYRKGEQHHNHDLSSCKACKKLFNVGEQRGEKRK